MLHITKSGSITPLALPRTANPGWFAVMLRAKRSNVMKGEIVSGATDKPDRRGSSYRSLRIASSRRYLPTRRGNSSTVPGKMAPEHRRLSRYGTLTVAEIAALPVPQILLPTAHLYLWVPNALLPEGLQVLRTWGFAYKSNIVWHKVRKDGGSDGRGVGFYFRNVTELILFGTRGKDARTLAPGRRQVNYIGTRKREHSRKPDELYDIIQACSPGPYLELFARGLREEWAQWGEQANGSYEPTWKTYSYKSVLALTSGTEILRSG